MKRKPKAPALLTLFFVFSLSAGPVFAEPPRAVTGGVEFSYSADLAFSVHWAGEYNEWSTSATPMTEDDEGVWRVVVPLGPGEHEYKFVVDGNWITDPDNPKTQGEYGNSLITVASDGSLDEGRATGQSPMALNPKLFLGGLYYANYQLESQEREGDRVLLEKPLHDINLAFEVRLNPSLTGNVELNIDNIAEITEMWRTHLNVQRSYLKLKRPSFTLQLFENKALFSSNDPLHIAGAVGTYNYDYGYSARGIVLSKLLPLGIDFKALVADASLDQPQRPSLSDSDWPMEIIEVSPDSTMAVPFDSTVYKFNNDRGYRDDFAFQFRREISGTRLLYLARAVRGIKPGFLLVQTGSDADSTLNRYNYRTVQNNLLHAFAIGRDWGQWLSADLEWVSGNAKLRAKDLAVEVANGATDVDINRRVSKDWTLQKTRGFAVVVQLFRGENMNFALRHRYQKNRDSQDHLLESAPADSILPDLHASARSYGLAFHYERGDFHYTLDLEQEEFDFGSGLGWGDHFWFADGHVGADNLWINGDHLPLDKYGLLGYRSASVIRQRMVLPVNRGRGGELDWALSSSISSTRLDRSPLYWELVSEWRWRWNQEWSVLFNQRFASWNHDFLGLDQSFTNNFLELSYQVGRSAVFSLGYGVDPYWFDPSSKEFLPHGRREFLADQGADEDALRNNYKRIGNTLRRAEDEMSAIQRISLEARFEF